MLGTLPRRHERQFVGTGSPPPSYLQGVRSGATLFLLAAVGILAALALADALRKDDVQPAAGQATTSAVVRTDGGGDIFRCRLDVDRGRIVSGHASDAGKLVVRAGAILSGDRVVLTHADLLRAARRHPNVVGYDRSIPLHIGVDDLASFGVQEPVVAMTISARYLEPQYLLALFDGHDVRAVATSFRGPYRDLFMSADGALVGAEDGTVVTRTGRTIDPPQGLPTSRAIAFSPDDRWVVRVNGISTFLVGAPDGGQAARIIRLPIRAQDLVWEPVTSGTSVGPPIRR